MVPRSLPKRLTEDGGGYPLDLCYNRRKRERSVMAGKRRTAERAVPRKSAATVFKSIDQVLRKPGSGCGNALQYMEQSNWMLFLRYLDAAEANRRSEAELNDEPYEPLLPKGLAWSDWAWPTKADGSLDTERMLKGDALLLFIQSQLFPGLRALRDSAAIDSPAYRVGAIFSELTCSFTDGYLIREVIDLIQPLVFETEAARHELSVLYEERLQAMGNAGRDGGQYYTPRPLIKVMVRVLAPTLGETIYDGACGSGGFLCEAFEYLQEKTRDGGAEAYDILQHKTFYGCEEKALPYVTAQMNCILHGLRSPNIEKGDTLSKRIADFTDRDRVDIILANPPFGAATSSNVAANFTIKTGETALLFMEHFIAKLKTGGRAAIVIKNTFLSNGDSASVAIRKLLLNTCRLHWVLDLPPKVFAAGVRTVVLFFSKDGPTQAPIHYYQLNLPAGVSLGKTRPLREEDLAEFEALATAAGDPPASPNAWTLDPATLDPETCDLSVRNPNIREERPPSASECLTRLRDLHAEMDKLLNEGFYL